MKRTLFGLVAALASATPGMSAAQAQSGGEPFVFVLPTTEDGRDGSNLAWWLKASIVRPMGTEVSGVTIERLNEARGESAPNRWCFASPLTRQSFTSPVRSIQQDIDASMTDAYANFSVTAPLTDGDPLNAVVGNYENCDGSSGAFLLITDQAPTPNVVFIDEWENWKGLIWLNHDDDALVVSSCFACGHAESLFYDPRRDRFYWANTGD